MSIIDELVEIYAIRGEEVFEGDDTISQTAHGLQTAMVAEDEGAGGPMIVAALLHDIGRIINPRDRDITDSGRDAKHEEVGRKFLEPWFGPEVTMPIKWHVAAKRYLIATEPEYVNLVSEGAMLSMTGQGDVMPADEIAAFIAQPFAPEGVVLRRWDDRAKSHDVVPPPFEHFSPIIGACLKNRNDDGV